MGNLMRPEPFCITLDISAVKSVEIAWSVKCVSCEKPITSR